MASTTTITMRFLTTSLLLLITCCLWPVHGQNGDNNNIWDKPIQFTSKAKDTCSMIVSLQNDVTRLKVSCKSATREYSCEFLGRPHTCRSYNGNPRHYFTQIMWELRKLANACEGRRALKPQMCKRATDDAQMIFAPTASQERQPGQVRPEAPKVGTPKPATAQTKSEAAQIKPPRAKPDTAPAKPAQAKPEAPAVKSPRDPQKLRLPNHQSQPPKEWQKLWLRNTAGSFYKASALMSSTGFTTKSTGSLQRILELSQMDFQNAFL
ncbi:fibroblast growth factor-binding protein 2-like [Arapaima gigas]